MAHMSLVQHINLRFDMKQELLPKWFKWPAEYERIKSLNLTDLEPWVFLDESDFEFRIKGMKERYPNSDLVPFARRQDNDDVACWEKEGGNEKVVIIHDYASSGWEKDREFPTFWGWFKQAIDDMIEYEAPYR